jgi:hypothetical protein
MERGGIAPIEANGAKMKFVLMASSNNVVCGQVAHAGKWPTSRSCPRANTANYSTMNNCILYSYLLAKLSDV